MRNCVTLSPMHLAIPSNCLCCGILNSQLICQDCQSTLPWRGHACIQCGCELVSAIKTHCGTCLKNPPLWDRLLAPWRYEAPLPQLIHRMKFNFSPQLAGFLGKLAIPLLQAYHELDPVDLIVPVPLHRLRIAKRCYNQAEWIARTLAKGLNCPLNTHHLRRTRHTRAQAKLELPVARHANTQAAFCLIKPVPAQHVALVDDVVTTGATIKACIHAWQAVSPARFSVWCLARADGRRYP